MRELQFIEIIKNTLSDSSLIGDDTACVGSLVLTQDTLVEDIHFRLSTIKPFELGFKAVSINLSDIAAAGGIPKYVLVSLSLPNNTQNSFVEELYEGINNICLSHNVIVAGGDITGGERVSVTVSAIGQKPENYISKRSNAKIGDMVVVTGCHGSSRAGFELIEKGIKTPKELIKAHTTPAPRLKEGQAILKAGKTPAMMDTSDGLADALYKIGKASDVTLEVNFEKVPYNQQLLNIPNCSLSDWVLFGGEDYEILACISKDAFQELTDKGIELYLIGEVVEKSTAPAIININNAKFAINSVSLAEGSFDHFKGD